MDKPPNDSPTAEAQARSAMPTYPPEMRDKCYQLYKIGKTQLEIVAETGIPRVTVQRWSQKDKWKDRKKLELFDIKPKAMVDGADLTFAEKQDRYREGMAVQALRLPEIMAGMDDMQILMASDKIKNLDGTARKALNLEESRPTTVINVALLARPVVPLELPEPAIEAEIVSESTPELCDERTPELCDGQS